MASVIASKQNVNNGQSNIIRYSCLLPTLATRLVLVN